MLYITFLRLSCNWKFIPLNPFHLFCPTPHPPPSLAVISSVYLWTCFCFCFVSFFLNPIDKLNHMVFIFLCLDSFNNTLWVCSCCCKWQNFIFSYGWVIFYCINILHLLHPFIYWYALSMNIGVPVSFQLRVFIFFG